MKFSLLAVLVAFIGHAQLASAGSINGVICSSSADCNSGFCTTSGKCGWSTTTIGHPPGHTCTQNSDCNSTICITPQSGAAQCAKYSGAGGPCLSANDCLSASCDVTTNSCQQGTAPGPLPVGSSCIFGSECMSFSCSNGQCAAGTTGNTDGNSNLLRPGDICNSDTQCASGSCNLSNNTCTKFSAYQGTCRSNDDCMSGLSCNTNGICSPPDNNGPSDCSIPLSANLVPQLNNLRCSRDSDCQGLLYPAGPSSPPTDAWCWAGANGSTCGPSPSDPPACISQCVQTCDTNAPTGSRMEDECSCFSQCNISNCHSDYEKKVVSHVFHDVCGLPDPFFHGGSDITCPKGMYVKNKGHAGQEVCAKCQMGTYSLLRSHKNKKCKRCPIGYIQPDEGMSKCYRCEDGKTADHARVRCV